VESWVVCFFLVFFGEIGMGSDEEILKGELTFDDGEPDEKLYDVTLPRELLLDRR